MISPNLLIIWSNGFGSSHLVKILVNWFSLHTNGVWISLAWTFSRTKWQSTSIWFVLSWNIRDSKLCIAAWLSQNILIGLLGMMHISAKSYLIQINSLEVDVMARYSASALDRAITFYFLLFHVTKFLPTNVHKPIVDFRLKLPAQSGSE